MKRRDANVKHLNMLGAKKLKSEMVPIYVRDHPVKSLDRYRVWGYQLTALKAGPPGSITWSCITGLFGVSISTFVSRIYASPTQFCGELTYWLVGLLSALLGISLLVQQLNRRKKVNAAYEDIINIEPEDVEPENDKEPVGGHAPSIEGDPETKAGGPDSRGGADNVRKVVFVDHFEMFDPK